MFEDGLLTPTCAELLRDAEQNLRQNPAFRMIAMARAWSTECSSDLHGPEPRRLFRQTVRVDVRTSSNCNYVSCKATLPAVDHVSSVLLGTW